MTPDSIARHPAAWLAALALLNPFAAFAQARADGWAALAQPGTIVLFRHATAPGVGDPPNFKPDDCATQRNLSDEGRAEARRIGEQFRTRGIKVGAVLSSQWCRTRETARLAFGEQAVRDEPAFNSQFGRRGEADTQTARARAILQKWKGPGVLVVVTHQVNISALAEGFTSSAEGVVMRPAANGRLEVLGRVSP
ncbi:MAG: histidine phosphatase family protein [Pseudomonadota bacterium]